MCKTHWACLWRYFNLFNVYDGGGKITSKISSSLRTIFDVGIYRGVVYIKKRYRGSYTVEGTVIVSAICIIVGLTVCMGFFGHDCMVMKSTADELAMMGSLWSGRYVSYEYGEVDYEALKQKQAVELKKIEQQGYTLLSERLFLGKVQSISISKQILGHRVHTEICTDFKIGSYTFDYAVIGESAFFESNDLPRRKVEENKKNE